MTDDDLTIEWEDGSVTRLPPLPCSLLYAAGSGMLDWIVASADPAP